MSKNRKFLNGAAVRRCGFASLILTSLILIYQATRSSISFDEVIHIVYMMGGNSYSRHLFHTHLKSLLSFSNSSLHLHVIADSENIEDVTVLLDTWHLPRCQYTFYDEKDYTDKISWLPFEHYSKQFGYLKLEILNIVKNVDKVLTLDVDLVVQVDVKELWDMFDKFNETHFLAMGESTSPWYTSKHPENWPAVGNGYNSGVQLMDLDKMRSVGFSEKWKSLAERHYARIKSVPIADQDVFNSWIFENPSTFMALPCHYNFEIGGRSKPNLCLQAPRLIHFNTPSKAPNPGLERYAEVRKTYMEMDGEDLKLKRRRGLNGGETIRILPNAYGRRNPSKLCWGTHLGVAELESFLDRALLWQLPIAVVVVGNDSDVHILSQRVKALLRDDISIHNVFGKDSRAIASRTKFLRKILIDHSNCEQFLITSADFNFIGGLSKAAQILFNNEKEPWNTKAAK